MFARQPQALVVWSGVVEPLYTLLASAGGGTDQCSFRTKCAPATYVGKGRLIGGKGVIFPDSHRSGDSSLRVDPAEPADQ
jgi:hypothetical protein